MNRLGTAARAAAVIGVAVLALTGCRGGRPAGADASGPAPVVSTGAAVTGPASGADGSGAGGPGASGPGGVDPTGIDQDLAGLSSVDAGIGADLDAAASDAARPDNS
ncbi:MAG TPA: hypothetical protein VFP72_18200 [Kineosporiaceae bacterium]|nr:hypothetical protein [Kineosporiaceae bacterium]